MSDQRATSNDEWHQTACILGSLNCGLEVQISGPDGRHITS